MVLVITCLMCRTLCPSSQCAELFVAIVLLGPGVFVVQRLWRQTFNHSSGHGFDSQPGRNQGI